MNIADDFTAINQRLRELQQEQAKVESEEEPLTQVQKILRWNRMIQDEKARRAGRSIMIISQPRNPFVPPC